MSAWAIPKRTLACGAVTWGTKHLPAIVFAQYVIQLKKIQALAILMCVLLMRRSNIVEAYRPLVRSIRPQSTDWKSVVHQDRRTRSPSYIRNDERKVHRTLNNPHAPNHTLSPSLFLSFSVSSFRPFRAIPWPKTQLFRGPLTPTCREIRRRGTSPHSGSVCHAEPP